jgi:hypothetical protein
VTPDAPGAHAIGNTAIAASALRRFRDNEVIGVLSKGVCFELCSMEHGRREETLKMYEFASSARRMCAMLRPWK